MALYYLEIFEQINSLPFLSWLPKKIRKIDYYAPKFSLAAII